jgi:predicted DNA-binding WGR domain protein
MKRTFSYTDDKSSRTWIIETEGEKLTVTSTRTRSFDSEGKCLKAVEKQIAEKIEEGYVEERDGDPPEVSEKGSLRQGPEYAAEVESLMKVIAAGDYAEAAEIAKDLLQNEGLTGHYRQRVQAQGIALASYLRDQELMDASTHNVPEPITNDALAYNLACLAAGNNDKPAMLDFIRRALRAGRTREQFAADACFGNYLNDRDFITALDGTVLPEPITETFFTMKDNGPHLKTQDRSDDLYRLNDGVPFTGEIQLPISFETEDFGTEKELPHFLYGCTNYIFSLQLLSAFRDLGIDRFQTFPVVITDQPSGRVWDNYVLVNTLGRDNVMDAETKADDELAFDVQLVLDDRKLNNSDRFLAVKNPGVGSDWLILSGAAREELKQCAPLPNRKWGFQSIEVPVADHAPMPKPEDLTAEEWCGKCEAYLGKKLWKLAGECAANAVARDGKNHLSWYWLARANTYDLGTRYDEAKEHKALLDKGIGLYEKSLALKPDYVPAWIGLFGIYDASHNDQPRYDEEKAAECLRKALEADGRCEEAYVRLVGYCGTSDESSLEIARKWTENMPENPRAWYEYAEYLRGDENLEARIAAYEKMLSIQRIPVALYKLGMAYHTADPEKALSYLSQITKQDTKDFSRGWWVFFDDAWDSTRRAIKELTQKQKPIVRAELADAFSDEPVFWILETKGSSLTITAGKMGGAGESETASFNSKEECQKAAHALYDEKIKNYYPLEYFHPRLDLQYEQSHQAKALEGHYAELSERVRSLSKEERKNLPKAIADPLAVLDALDDEEIIKAYTSDILMSAISSKGGDYEAQGMVFEWYYDGDNNYDEAYGCFYEKCRLKDGYPKVGGRSDEDVGGIGVGLVMEAFYGSLSELSDNDSDLSSLIGELFETKVFLLAERAYREAEKLMDLPYFLMNQHDNDPTFIAAPRGK